ncbi:unnamed protein product [Effrenium voratum]|nr:unnamed protein product [Effrenium voratum]
MEENTAEASGAVPAPRECARVFAAGYSPGQGIILGPPGVLAAALRWPAFGPQAKEPRSLDRLCGFARREAAEETAKVGRMPSRPKPVQPRPLPARPRSPPRRQP